MNKGAVVIGALFLSSCSALPFDATVASLPGCSIEDSPFAEQPFDEWVDTYHSTVGSVVDELLGAQEQPVCSESDVSPPAGDALTTLAATLPPWEEEFQQETLDQADAGAVLLEYVRTYECALLHERDFTQLHIAQEAEEEGRSLDQGELFEESAERERIIGRELEVARRSLDRTFTLLTGIQRLSPLTQGMHCLALSSQDIRNVTGLFAETSSCLPKVYDARLPAYER